LILSVNPNPTILADRGLRRQADIAGTRHYGLSPLRFFVISFLPVFLVQI